MQSGRPGRGGAGEGACVCVCVGGGRGGAARIAGGSGGGEGGRGGCADCGGRGAARIAGSGRRATGDLRGVLTKPWRVVFRPPQHAQGVRPVLFMPQNSCGSNTVSFESPCLLFLNVLFVAIAMVNTKTESNARPVCVGRIGRTCGASGWRGGHVHMHTRVSRHLPSRRRHTSERRDSQLRSTGPDGTPDATRTPRQNRVACVHA